MISIGSIRKVLIIQTAFTGDVVLATPVIERIHRCHPDAEIHFLLRKGNEALLQGHPSVAKVLIRDKKLGKLKSLLQILKKVRAEQYDVVVNLHRFASSGFLAALSGSKHVCGFDKNPWSFLFNKKVPHVIGDGIHEVDRDLSVVAHFTQGPPDAMRLYPSAADFDTVKRIAPYVCIAPTSVWFTKQWPAEKWVELIRHLPPSLEVLLLGGPADAATCEAIKIDCGRDDVAVLAGKLSFLQSAALMAGARMNFVNDSAPLHFASAMEAPVTAVFCSTIPDFGFGPRGNKGRIVQTPEKLDCRPCGLHGHRSCPQGHFRCADIPVAPMVEGWHS